MKFTFIDINAPTNIKKLARLKFRNSCAILVALTSIFSLVLISASTSSTATENAKSDPQAQVDVTPTPPAYLDNRTTPQTLIRSYYNAINRKELARAFSYYSEGQEPDFKQYAAGYANTAHVQVRLGKTEPDPGAGQIYWTLPLAIEATHDDKTTQVYTGCYTIRMSNPAMQEVPPFKPMTIMAGTLTKSPLSLEESVPEECGAP